MPKLTAMMIVRNEAGRYLERCLKSLSAYTDEIVILDDASSDATPELCASFPAVKLYRRETSLFLIDEARLRQELWDYTAATSPEWILALDADELLEDRAAGELPCLLRQDLFPAVGFRLFDCWGGEDYYRVDGLWSPWLRGFSIYLVKYQPHLPAAWPAQAFHCGRLPLAYRRLPYLESDLRIKHLGWANPAEIRPKYERAVGRDPTFKYQPREHYESILWPPKKIQLEKWREMVAISYQQA
ncbi:glycosyltransferase [Moorella naiadis]|uniref:glycosyltransferase n=1 Tax=Moorella naiadis (nom. illeg.) TaxID=3093670 RepID=UPI003D9C95BB